MEEVERFEECQDQNHNDDDCGGYYFYWTMSPCVSVTAKRE